MSELETKSSVRQPFDDVDTRIDIKDANEKGDLESHCPANALNQRVIGDSLTESDDALRIGDQEKKQNRKDGSNIQGYLFIYLCSLEDPELCKLSGGILSNFLTLISNLAKQEWHTFYDYNLGVLFAILTTYCHSFLENQDKALEKIFLITNLAVELPSAVFDQLSSVHKPQYALISMIMSFTVMLISIIDLARMGRRERVKWMRRGKIIPWFYSPYPIYKPLGTFADIVGLISKESSSKSALRRLKTAHPSRRGLQPPDYPSPSYETPLLFQDKNYYRDLSEIAEQAKRRAEVARLRELHTLKGHVESVVRT
ncbi:hypothetical protein GH714_004472 [Hevea brasiliensis]|uniref:Uncharacterized protein n=1 Tax=Hevea brasiliensis TaxID=3981 RepID=A0A6A6KXJ4_HEVBR|nr:hypothetical protein GH714_004472 [Hevea brasiliensis]